MPISPEYLAINLAEAALDEIRELKRERQGMTKDIPDAELIISVRLMHLIGKTYTEKAKEIISDLRVHGFEIVRSSLTPTDKP